MTQNVLVVHHDADWYGADQSLFRAVVAMTMNGFHPIVILPRDGPLVPRLLEAKIEIHFAPVGRLTRQTLRPSGVPRLILEVIASLKRFNAIVGKRDIAFVYSNTIALLGGGVWARLHRRPHLWHVREIVVAPSFAANGFPKMVNLIGGGCVCNSAATRRWLIEKAPSLSNRSCVVWNGVEPPRIVSEEAINEYRASLKINPGSVLVTLVGRVNRWKGQGTLIDAAAKLKREGLTGVRFLLVGDTAPGLDHFREALFDRIRANEVADIVDWRPFTSDVDTVWAASDIAVVPSIEPEPFGRVAIEAMSHGLPVIASAHGGVTEIVVDGETGRLVTPGSADELAEAIKELVNSPELRSAWGHAGRIRQREHFDQTEVDRQLMHVFRDVGRLASTESRDT